MKHKIPFLVLFLIIFILFFSINHFLLKKNINYSPSEQAILNIYLESKINLEDSEFNDIKSEDYKSIINKKVIWKWFFINNSWEFLTSKHLFNNNSWYYYINIDNINYNFNILEKSNNSKLIIDSSKDIVLWKISNYKNNNFIQLNNDNLVIWSTVFIIKNNIKIYWKIISTNNNIDELNLTNLIKTNIKLESWDSWSPIFNKNWEVIWINVAIKENDNISFFQEVK